MARPLNRGSRTGSSSHPRAQFTRFTSEENDRLVRLCRKRKLTVQSFMHAAAMRALNEAELGKKTDVERRRDEEEGSREREYAPQGLGLRERLRESSVDDEPRERESREEIERPMIAPSTAPMLTRVMAADEIGILARTIVESPTSTRRDVLAAAVRSLARGRSRDEAVRLAEDLDAEIRRLGGGEVPKTALERVRARAAK